MRNLAQYPITYEEKIQLLQELRDKALAEHLVGDMRPLLLNEIIEDLVRLQKIINGVIKI